jgi:hypothetical protein
VSGVVQGEGPSSRQVPARVGEQAYRPIDPRSLGLQRLLLHRQQGDETGRLLDQQRSHRLQRQTEIAQDDDKVKAAQMLGTIDLPTRRGARRPDQSFPLIDPQSLGRDANPSGGLARPCPVVAVRRHVGSSPLGPDPV